MLLAQVVPSPLAVLGAHGFMGQDLGCWVVGGKFCLCPLHFPFLSLNEGIVLFY